MHAQRLDAPSVHLDDLEFENPRAGAIAGTRETTERAEHESADRVVVRVVDLRVLLIVEVLDREGAIDVAVPHADTANPPFSQLP